MMPLPTDFTEWINPRLTVDYWATMMPAQQMYLSGVDFVQFLKSHSDSNIPSYTSAMNNYNAGMKVPNLITGKPSDVPYTWQQVFPSIVADLREAQLIVNVFDAPDSIGFEVDTRVYFDGVLWHTTPTLTLAKSAITDFTTAPDVQVWIASNPALARITGNEWREVAIVE